MRTMKEQFHLIFWRVLEGSFWLFLLICSGLFYVWFNEEPAERWIRRSIETPQVVAGEYLVIRSRLYRSKICGGWIERRMYDGIGAETKFDPDLQNGTFIGPEDRRVKVPVPLSASPGPAIYRPRACWECNPLQRFFPHCEDLQELKFIILPPKHLPQSPLQQPSVETSPWSGPRSR
jgi:hypothetical protein